MEQTHEKCIIVKDLPEPLGTSRHVGLSQEIYDQLMELSKQTGRSLRWLANRLIAYGLENVEVQE